MPPSLDPLFLHFPDDDSDSDGSVVKRKKIIESDDDGLSDMETGGDKVTGRCGLLLKI